MFSASAPSEPAYYAHTAEDAAGNRLPECDWQPLHEHFENVARLAAGFAASVTRAERGLKRFAAE